MAMPCALHQDTLYQSLAMTTPYLLSSAAIVFISLSVISLLPSTYSADFADGYNNSSVPETDLDLLEFPLNLEYLEAEFFLYGALGHGLDKVAPELADGGPSPIGAKKANLDTLINDVVLQFAYQEVGHLKAIKKTVKGFPRPQLDLSASLFAKVIDKAFGKPLMPPFDPYANSINFLIASYLIPYVGLTGYVGANPKLQGAISKRLVAGLLGVESGQDAVIRGLLYQHATVNVFPYQFVVAEFTNRISNLRNTLGRAGTKDEGLIVPVDFGAEGKVVGNVLAGDEFSVAFDRTPEEILRIVYGSGNESVPGGFFPKGADGNIAKSYLS
ncbi:desiccation-related protein PCC13-62-like [Hibiscus syriacus]|uniref:desiccation-related protein PCC13-62-like n=1 Tax=Hibiscus syriacus TaxID=106335 RepID=UPI0019237A25|nr:desiccation-related protein PCC13-62-like [Hibiscus syriacus]